MTPSPRDGVPLEVWFKRIQVSTQRAGPRLRRAKASPSHAPGRDPVNDEHQELHNARRRRADTAQREGSQSIPRRLAPQRDTGS